MSHPLTTYEKYIFNYYTMKERKEQIEFKEELVSMKRPKLWMQQIERSGNEYSQAWQILRAFGVLIGFCVWLWFCG
jgi:hypothetical protein